MEKSLDIKKVNKFFLFITLLFFLFNIIIVFFSNYYGYDITQDNIYSFLLFIQLGLLLLPVMIFTKIQGVDFRQYFRLNPLKAPEVLLIVIISFFTMYVASVLNSIVVFFLQRLGEVPSDSIPIPKDVKELVIEALIVAVAPAICEELLNRGLILRSYEILGRKWAIIISAVYFGIFHFDIRNFLGPVFMGILIAYYVIRTNSIFAGMLAHFTNNFLSLFMSFFFREEYESESMTITADVLTMQIAGSIFFVGIIFFLLMIFNAVTREKNQKFQENPEKISVRDKIFHWPIILVWILYIMLSLLTILSIAQS